MIFLKNALLLFLLISFTACNSTKEITKEETNSSLKNTKIPKATQNPKTTQTQKSTQNIKSIKSKIYIKKKTLFQKKLALYLEALQTFNTDVIVNMTYPRLFSVIDPKLFGQYMNSMINSTDIQMISYTTTPSKVSPIRRFSNGTEFAQINYQSTISLQFLNPNLYSSREQMNYLYDVSIHKFGVENVSIDINKRILKVTKPERLLAIKEQNSQWKFLGDDVRYRKYFPRFMPPEILQNLE